VSFGLTSGREGKTLGHMPRAISKVAWFILRYEGTDIKIIRWMKSAVSGRGQVSTTMKERLNKLL